MDDFPRDELIHQKTTPVNPVSYPNYGSISDSVIETDNKSEPISSATSAQDFIHRLSSWIESYKSLIHHIQTLDKTIPVDRLTPKLVTWQAPLAAAGVTIAQREQQLKRVLKSYGKMMITRDGNDPD